MSDTTAPVRLQAWDDEPADGPRAMEILAAWGDTLLDARHLQAGVYTIGSGTSVSHLADAALLPVDPFVLARAGGERFDINVPESATGEVMLVGQIYALEDLRAAGRLAASPDAPETHTLRLPPRARCRLRIGAQTFHLNSVAAAAPVRRGPWWQLFDGQLGHAVLTAGLLHGLFAAVVLSIPDDMRNLGIDSLQMTDRWVEYILRPETPKPEDNPLARGPDEDGEPAAAAAGDEGAAGEPDAPKRDTRRAVKGDQEDVKLARARDRRKALDAAASAFHELEATSIWSHDDHAIGADALHAVGHLTGDDIGPSDGVRGLGVASLGRGGGGFDETSVRVGDPRTRGRLSGPGGRRYGTGVTRYQDRPDFTPEVVPLPPKIVGGLDQEVIQRVIRAHRAEYRYCYERALNSKRDLEGKITVRFVIAGTGKVIATAILDSSMGEPSVEKCLREKIARWQFPEPAGHGTVIVKYPFLFKHVQ